MSMIVIDTIHLYSVCTLCSVDHAEDGTILIPVSFQFRIVSAGISSIVTVATTSGMLSSVLQNPLEHVCFWQWLPFFGQTSYTLTAHRPSVC